MLIQITPAIGIPEEEIEFRFTRSSGPGGQNVNKVSTRVELLFNIRATSRLTQDEKERISSKLGSRIDAGGLLRVASQESRSQWKNRQTAVEKFAALLRGAVAVKKARKKSKPSRASKESRFEQKKTHARKKELRRRIRSAEG